MALHNLVHYLFVYMKNANARTAGVATAMSDQFRRSLDGGAKLSESEGIASCQARIAAAKANINRSYDYAIRKYSNTSGTSTSKGQPLISVLTGNDPNTDGKHRKQTLTDDKRFD